MPKGSCNLLSVNEKYILWMDKIDKIIEEDNLNIAQLNLIYDLKDKLSVNLFNEDLINDEREIFKSIFVNQFLNKTIGVFEKDYIKTNFFTVAGRINYIAEPEGPDTGESKCTCNATSMWSCAMATTTCKTTSNYETLTSGCGFMGFYECTGKCYFN